ncbi:MAG: hypothetical protein DHS80DRAFT_32533 [Piptocephalis tieghemiana]|nr:MAG: hypothetical protein DHS80DRAFT_32533 [Piptocephalis tieghemiana]
MPEDTVALASIGSHRRRCRRRCHHHSLCCRMSRPKVLGQGVSRSQSEVTSTTSSPSSSPTSSFLPQHHHPQHSKPKITKPLESSNVRSSSPATTPSQFPFVNSLPPSGISSPVSQGPSPTDPLFSPPIPFNTQVPIHFGHKQQYVLDDRSRLRLILTGILVITLLMSVPILVAHFENVNR